jgi:hypothetical protein
LYVFSPANKNYGKAFVVPFLKKEDASILLVVISTLLPELFLTNA